LQVRQALCKPLDGCHFRTTPTNVQSDVAALGPSEAPESLEPAVGGLEKSMPDGVPISKIAPVYKKGMGSLGRPRFVA
jgi:hypothetical protein